MIEQDTERAAGGERAKWDSAGDEVRESGRNQAL